MTAERAKSVALSGRAHERLSKFQSDLGEVLKIQCSHGNWNYSPYMMGLANGLIMAETILTGQDPKYLTAPGEWLQDRHTTGAPETAEGVDTEVLLCKAAGDESVQSSVS